ncbi:MAG: hypothetical protein Q8T09_11465 [Candidatus Melainabacteria bacterium]|nr:hypothetical protein [Candidatus Melainabacteria bacterium]
MNFPLLIIIEVAFAGLLAAASTRFNLQVVGANLPDCDKEELATTVRQTTGFALIAGALSVQSSDNLFQSGMHALQASLWVTAIMSTVLLWNSMPTIIAAASEAIDAAAEKIAKEGIVVLKSFKDKLVAAIRTATKPKVTAIKSAIPITSPGAEETTATRLFSIGDMTKTFSQFVRDIIGLLQRPQKIPEDIGDIEQDANNKRH